MTAAAFRRMALSLPGAIEGSHMDHPDFRAHGRIFASLHPDDRHGVVKLTPEQQRELLLADAATFAPASGAWGRQGYTMVRLAAVDEERLGEAMTLAWRNVAGAAGAGQKKKPRASSTRRSARRR
jgi:hypothetical protein